MYTDIQIVQTHPNDTIAASSRELIVNDILSGDTNAHYMSAWYTRSNEWYEKSFSHCYLLYDNFDQLIAMSSNSLQPDNTMKILCHFYILKDFRNKYRGIHQTNIIPKDVEYGIKHNLNGIWYSIHPFDKRHKRYSESQKRLLNGSKLHEEIMPYWKSFVYVGNVIYKNVIQEKFYMDLTNV